jgi:hypothetical protein
VAEDPADAAGSFVGEAVGVETLVAVRAGTAGADARQQDPVTDLDGRDGRALLEDDPDTFVPQDASGRDRRDVALEDVQVGPGSWWCRSGR